MVRRHRRCDNCQHRFVTEETLERPNRQRLALGQVYRTDPRSSG